MGQLISRRRVHAPVVQAGPLAPPPVIVSVTIPSPNPAPTSPPTVACLTSTSIRDVNLSTLNTIGPFTLIGVKGEAWVKSVYDGDTLHLVILFDTAALRQIKITARTKRAAATTLHDTMLLIAMRSRLARLDARELRDVGGADAKRLLEQELPADGYVWVTFGNPDKYGRPLVELYADSHYTKSINSVLLRNHPDYFLPYDGKKKRTFGSLAADAEVWHV